MKKVSDMKHDHEYHVKMAAQHERTANMLEQCITCQTSKMRKVCGADCPNLAVQS